MAGASAEEQDMQGFVRGLFQGSPDLSILTHAIVRKKYLAHVGQETLTKEEKEKLKQLVEEELVQMQVDDPPSSREVLTKLETLVKSGGQKRHLCTSDTSGDEVKSSREQKKQRTGKELKVSSDEQDSGIDSKKMPVYSRPRSAGMFSGTLDKGDSGAEDHSDGSGSNRESTMKKRREAGGRKTSQEYQSARQKGSSGSEPEDSKEGQERRDKIRSQDESESWEESEDDSEDEDRRRKKVTSRKQGRKSVKVGESESDSDNTGDSWRRKEAPQTKTREADEGKQDCRLESNSEDGEEPERWIGKGGMKKTQRKNVSRKELEGEQNNSERGCTAKKEGRGKPKRSTSSSDESESGTNGSKSLLHKRGENRTSSSEGGESQSEADTGGNKSRQPPGRSSESESGSENSEVEDRGKKRTIKKRSKGVSGTQDEKSKGKATAKPQKESVSEMESEEELEDSGSGSDEKRKREGRQKKGMPKPRRSSKGASENEPDEERGGSSSEENPHYSKQRHRGKDREHSGKSEDHPSIQRLKRYIRECGVHRNYKKLLAGCRSRRAQVEALKKELENIGLKGTPSLAKCKALKKKREEAAEVASLDLSNIITTEGRPRRRNVWSLYSKPQESPSSPEESPIRRPATDWSHLRGVISSDGESS